MINSLSNRSWEMLLGHLSDERDCSIILAIFLIREDGRMSLICVLWLSQVMNLETLGDSVPLLSTQERLENRWLGISRVVERVVGTCLAQIFPSNCQMDHLQLTQTVCY